MLDEVHERETEHRDRCLVNEFEEREFSFLVQNWKDYGLVF